MKHYAFIQNDKINGCGQCKQLADGVLNIEITEEIYNNIKKYIYQDDEIILDPDYKTKEMQKEKERIAQLYLTGADVERGIYQARGMDFEDVIKMVENLQKDSSALPQNDDYIDIKALKIELKANNFYRGNPYVEAIGALLGFTSEQLDKFFEDGNYEYLLV